MLDRLIVSARDLLRVVSVHVETGPAALRDILTRRPLLGALDQSRICPLDRGDVGQQLTRIPALLVDAALERLIGQLRDGFLELLAVALEFGNQFFAVGNRHEVGQSAPVISLDSSQRRSAA